MTNRLRDKEARQLFNPLSAFYRVIKVIPYKEVSETEESPEIPDEFRTSFFTEIIRKVAEEYPNYFPKDEHFETRIRDIGVSLSEIIKRAEKSHK